MRLIYLLLSPNYGMHLYTADLANRMVQVHDVHLVTMRDYPADLYSPSVTVHTPITISNTGLSTEGLRIRRLKQLKRVLDSLNGNVVHITGPHLWNVYLIRQLHDHDSPVIHTIHDLEPHPGTRMARMLHLWNRMIIQNADMILVHGNRYRQQLLAQGIATDKVVHTPLLSLFLSHKNLESLNLNEASILYDRFILFFGRLESYKGIDTLLAAYKIMSRDPLAAENGHVDLILAGRGQLKRMKTIELPKGVDLRNRLILDDEAINLFRRCSLVVLPYRQATQSAIIGAAYYFFKPVVVTGTGALAEYVKDNQTGFIVPPEDPQALADTLAAALADEKKLRAMGKAGRKWYDDHRFQETQSLLTLYSSLSQN